VRILVVDDDPGVRDSLRRSLAFNGYEVDLAEDGQRGLAAIATKRPDAVVLDVMMPGLDGLETCRRLRAAGEDIPVLMLTAREAISDRVAGLDAGADDYLVKPFSLDELLARLRALLRRTLAGPDAGQQLKFSDLVLDPLTREVWRGKRSITLTRTEFHLLELFLRHPRQVLERAQILEEVWGYDFPTTANSLEVYVGYLRRKLEADDEPRLIHTVRGVGYSLRELPS
jgi:two-component system response regulator MprA